MAIKPVILTSNIGKVTIRLADKATAKPELTARKTLGASAFYATTASCLLHALEEKRSTSSPN